MTDKRKDLPTRTRVEQIGDSVDWVATKTNRVLIGIVIGLFILAFFTAAALRAAHSQVAQVKATAAISKTTAATSKATADRLAAVVKQIQIERERNTLNGCLETNARHDRTVRRLRKLARGSDPARVAATITLIDALAPHRDCDQVVRDQVQGSRP